MASITADILWLKTFSCTISSVFIVGSNLPNVLMKARALRKTDSF